jgi:CHAD domain-containing protein
VAQLLERGLAHRRAAQQPLTDVAAALLATRKLPAAIAEVSEKVAAASADGQEGTLDSDDLRDWAALRLKPFRSRFFRAARRNLQRGSRLHQFRIRTKDLRYAIELVAEQLPPGELGRVLTTVEKLQARLGEINDHRTAAQRYRQWEDEADDPEERAYLEANACAEESAFEAARDKALEWWTPRRRKRLKRRLKRLERSA